MTLTPWAKPWDLSCLCMVSVPFSHPKYIIAFLASRVRLRVGDVIKVMCHRNHPESLSNNEPLITPLIAPGWHPPGVVRQGQGLPLR
jgi:hypothetical protein